MSYEPTQASGGQRRDWGGGTKKKQRADIKAARSRWKDYKARKRKEQ